ncbi:flavin reductase family protein [Streptomyces odontomachi]|uniref:flavin reductase family protein n=1 Tax=Streptomyces odontomachi TaxID=2944940 RepID=UPI002109AA77|nr:flavin reductase family protein [Streptomyces sp. ODS25]
MTTPTGTIRTQPERAAELVESTAWHAARRFPTGVSVVTTGSGETAHGSTVSAFSFVSHDPPLVAICLARGSSLLTRIAEHRSYAVNVLAGHQSAVARHFASRAKKTGPAQFHGIGCTPGEGGVPRLTGTVSWLHCRVRDLVEAGDHVIVLGTVTDFGCDRGRTPLLYFAGHLHPERIRIEEDTP